MALLTTSFSHRISAIIMKYAHLRHTRVRERPTIGASLQLRIFQGKTPAHVHSINFSCNREWYSWRHNQPDMVGHLSHFHRLSWNAGISYGCIIWHGFLQHRNLLSRFRTCQILDIDFRGLDSSSSPWHWVMVHQLILRLPKNVAEPQR